MVLISNHGYCSAGTRQGCVFFFSSYCRSAVFQCVQEKCVSFLLQVRSSLMRCNDGVFRGNSAHSYFVGNDK